MVSVKFGADEYQLKSTWAASMEIHDLVGDPLEISVKFDEGDQVLSVIDIVKVLWIALKHSGEKFTLSEVGEKCHKYGTINYYVVAKAYIYSLVINESEEYDVSDTEGEAGKE